MKHRRLRRLIGRVAIVQGAAAVTKSRGLNRRLRIIGLTYAAPAAVVLHGVGGEHQKDIDVRAGALLDVDVVGDAVLIAVVHDAVGAADVVVHVLLDS